MKKLILMFMFTLFVVCVYKKDVKALSGSGTSGSPYQVTKGSELKEALSKGSSSWKYIAVTDLSAITETINVSTGKFRVYAKGGNQTIRRSQSMSAEVNSSSDPLRCIKLDGDTEIEWGYAANTYKLTLDGSKGYFTDRRCNEFFYVGTSAKLTICANCIFTNAKNTMNTNEASPIRDYGTVNLYGEISKCEGNNGGAIKCISGSVYAYSGSKIHDCKSGTEGGAIYAKDFADININECAMYNNEAAEEGGAIFSDKSILTMRGGDIHNNVAGKTGGGVFSGDKSTLYFGSNGSGPAVYDNYAKKSGGGVRCNGGTEISGGLSIFDGGTIKENKTDVSGGGISVGNPSSNSDSKIEIANTYIADNQASNYGGGICFSPGVRGKNNGYVTMTKCAIISNKSGEGGGGIHLNTVLKMTGNTLRSNNSSYGGGVRIAGEGTLRITSGIIENNYAYFGSGVYQNGLIELSGNGCVDESNAVYLASGKHIDITEKLTVSKVLVSYIDSEVKTKGTILVDVTYSGGTAESELYYEGSSEDEEEGKDVRKRYRTASGHLLRPSSKNTSFDSSRYIIISDKYSVKYDGNSLDPVANLPEDEIAFWNEKYKVSDNTVSRIGFVLNNNKHWNLSADGTGKVLKPGLDTFIDSDTRFYAIWEDGVITSLNMTTVDRYYFVGQDIALTTKELTKKVKVENNLHTDVSYAVKVTKIVKYSGSLVAQGVSLATQNYLNTETGGTYKLYLSSSDQQGTLSCSGTMNIYILDNYYDQTEVRFISKEFKDTLDPRSKWRRSLRYELDESLDNEDNYIFKVELDNDDVIDIRNINKSNKHKITHSINSIISQYII